MGANQRMPSGMSERWGHLKRIAALALVVGATLLAACSNSPNSSSTTTSAAATSSSSAAQSSTTSGSATQGTTASHGWVTTYCSTLSGWATAAAGSSGAAPTALSGWSAWAGQTASFANSVQSATNSAISTLQGAGAPAGNGGATIAHAAIVSFQGEQAAQTKVLKIVQGPAPTTTAQMSSLVQQIATANKQAGLSFAQITLQIRSQFPGDFNSFPACTQAMQQLQTQGNG